MNNEQRGASRLQQIDRDIARLRQAFDDLADRNQETARVAPRKPAEREENDTAHWQEISLEY